MRAMHTQRSATTPLTAPENPSPPREAAPRQVRQWLSNGDCVLIDVREPDEHARERIAGARLLPLSRFDAGRAIAMARPGQRIVVHCRSGRRSAQAARVISSVAGADAAVISMTGGIEAWKSDALRVEADARLPRLSVMRQAQIIIGSCVLAGAVLAWLVHPLFAAVPALFGAGLLAAGATGSCALAALVARLPWNTRCPAQPACESGACR